MNLFITNTKLFTLQDVNWWTGVMWITCGLLWCFYQLFGLSFWRHPFTARIHWWESDVMLNFSKSVLMKKQTRSHFKLPEGEYMLILIFGWTTPLRTYWNDMFLIFLAGKIEFTTYFIFRIWRETKHSLDLFFIYWELIGIGKVSVLDFNVTLHLFVEDESSSGTPPEPRRLFDRHIKAESHVFNKKKQ